MNSRERTEALKRIAAVNGISLAGVSGKRRKGGFSYRDLQDVGNRRRYIQQTASAKSAQRSTDEKAFPLLSLPGELRQMIYNAVLSPETPTDANYSRTQYERYQSLNLPSTCSQIYEETRSLRNEHQPYVLHLYLTPSEPSPASIVHRVDSSLLAQVERILLIIHGVTYSETLVYNERSTAESVTRHAAKVEFYKVISRMTSLRFISIEMKASAAWWHNPLLLSMLIRDLPKSVRTGSVAPSWDRAWEISEINNWLKVRELTRARHDRLRRK